MRKVFLFFTIAIIWCNSCIWAQDSSSFEIFNLSLQELMNVEIQSATKSPSKLKDVSASATIITSDDIRMYGWRNLADVLKAQVGFDVFSDRIYNFISNRGFYVSNDPNSRILLLINGHSVIEFFGYYNGQLASIDINFVDRIEIVKGPNSSIYGTNAMFAVINIITKKGNGIDGVEIVNEVGNFGHEKYSLALGKEFKNGLDFMVQGTYLKTGEQELYFEEYDNNSYASGGYAQKKCNREALRNISLIASYKNFTINSLLHDRHKNVPTGIYGGKFNDPSTYFNDFNHFFEIAYDFSIASWIKGQAKVYNDNYKFDGQFAFYKDSTWVLGPPYDLENNSIQNRTNGGEVFLRLNYNESQNTLINAEYKDFNYLDFDYAFDSSGYVSEIERFKFNPKTDLLSASILHEYIPNPKLKFIGGLRYDSYNGIADNLSFRGGVHYRPIKKLRTKLLYGEAFRAPNLWEINGGFYIMGNEKLKPEIVRNAEFIVDYDISENLKSTTSFFAFETDNLIQADSTFINVEGIYGKGVESELRYISPQINCYLSILYADVRDRLNDNHISFAPDKTLKGGFLKEVIKGKVALGVESQLIGERLLANRSMEELPPYSLTNITLSSAKLFNNLDISCSVYNLFNSKYEHPAFEGDLASYNMNTLYPIHHIPADKRSFVLKTRLKF